MKRPLSSSTGIWPIGLRWRCAALFASATATGSCSYFTPSSSSAHRQRAERDLEVPYNLTIGQSSATKLLIPPYLARRRGGIQTPRSARPTRRPGGCAILGAGGGCERPSGTIERRGN